MEEEESPIIIIAIIAAIVGAISAVVIVLIVLGMLSQTAGIGLPSALNLFG